MKLPAQIFWLVRPVAGLALAGWILSCSGSGTTEEIGQQVGDVMASIDESGGSSGSLAWSPVRTFERLAPGDVREDWWNGIFEKEAVAATCALSSGFGSCSGSTLTRDFDGCTIGLATFTGTVTLTWGVNNSGCTLSGTNGTITRVPDFTVTGRRGATLTVSKSGSVGQKLTYTSGTASSAGMTFTMTNDGIRRVFTDAGGSTMFDFTTETTADVTVTGYSRSNRILDGGTIKVTDNLTSKSCTFSPDQVTWAATCNCPTSGSWTGTCSDGSSTSIAITGCGTADVTVGTETDSVVFDRCYGV